jgi:hypothetical protein
MLEVAEDVCQANDLGAAGTGKLERRRYLNNKSGTGNKTTCYMYVGLRQCFFTPLTVTCTIFVSRSTSARASGVMAILVWVAEEFLTRVLSNGFGTPGFFSCSNYLVDCMIDEHY